MAMAEQATQTLAANGVCGSRGSHDFDEFIAEPLMVASAVIVLHELRERMPQVPLTERRTVPELRFAARPYAADRW